ncbi:MAG: response regulator [Ferruginibacter sp.]
MNPIHILLVEDNEGDIILTREALKIGITFNEISVVRDGEQAIRFFSKEGIYNEVKRPDLVLLDINLPRVDGIEVLNFVKTNAEFKAIPVIMLTTSTSEKDVLKCYENHANCYISKPVDLDKFFEVVQKVEHFWNSIVHLPKNN